MEEKVVREQKEEQPAANTKQQMRFALRFVWAGLVFVMFLPSHPNLSHPISCSPSLKPSTIRQGNRLWWLVGDGKEGKGQGTGRRKRATAVPSCSLRPFPDIFLTLSRLVPRFSLFISHVISKHPQHNFYMTNKKAKRGGFCSFTAARFRCLFLSHGGLGWEEKGRKGKGRTEGS